MAKPQKTERQAKIDAIRSQQQSAERRRGLMIVGVCAVVALLIIGAAAYAPLKDWWDVREFRDRDLSAIGAPASVCQEPEAKVAEGSQDHVDPGTPIEYPDAPPAFGTHYDVWDSIERKFYTAGDRPDVGELVHNLEHGYTIVWYDETLAGDAEAMDQLRGIATKFGDDTDLRSKVKVVPWTEEDGAAFPDGQHLAMTHWLADGKVVDEKGQAGVWQYCSEPSGEALEQFMLDFPYTNSPEPTAL